MWVAPASSLGEMSSYWPGLRAVVRVQRTRVHAQSGRVQSWVHYYGSSLAPTVRAHARAIREHLGVENGLHWVLDVQMGEDQCPIRDANGASNFAALRRFALMLLQCDKTVRQGTRGKQKEAGWNNDYLLHLLSRQGRKLVDFGNAALVFRRGRRRVGAAGALWGDLRSGTRRRNENRQGTNERSG